jgi:hypothetical protein
VNVNRDQYSSVELDYSDEEWSKNALDRGPYFEQTSAKNITAIAGHTAYLNCRVRNLGNKTVSYDFLSPMWHNKRKLLLKDTHFCTISYLKRDKIAMISVIAVYFLLCLRLFAFDVRSIIFLFFFSIFSLSDLMDP